MTAGEPGGVEYSCMSFARPRSVYSSAGAGAASHRHGALPRGHALGAKGAKRSQWEESAADSSLGLPQTEVFELFAHHRCKLLRWLEQHPRSRDMAMEAVVRTVTCTGPRALSGAAARAALHPRRWGMLRGFRGLGRYVPDTFTPPDLMQLDDDETAAAAAPAAPEQSQHADSTALLGGLPPQSSASRSFRGRRCSAVLASGTWRQRPGL